jgi:hypothetical protein
MFDVCTFGHTAHIEAIVQFLPRSDQHVKCGVSRATVIPFFKSGMLAGLRMRTKLEHLLFCSIWETYFWKGLQSRNDRLKPLQSFWYTLYVVIKPGR